MPTTTSKHPVGVNHPEYDEALDRWRRCRDVVAGTDAVKGRGTAYLPALSGHRDYETVGYKELLTGGDKYGAYKMRALFYGATRRTKMGLVGTATGKDPEVIATSTEAEDAAEKIIDVVFENMVSEQLEIGRCAILVDMKDDEMEPTFQLWYGENVVNWRYRKSESDNELAMVVLEEQKRVPVEGNPFQTDIKRVRHAYYLSNDTGLGDSCKHASYLWLEKEEDWTELTPETELMALGGRFLDHVPVIIVGVTDVDADEVEDPLLLDLADVNLSHYRNSADLEHGRHWTCLPTAWASGFPTRDDEGNEIVFSVGGESAWVTEVQGANAGYLEFSGSGLGHLAEGMKDKQAMMAVLGARLLEESKPAVEAAATIRMRMTGEKSALTYVVNTGSKALTWALREVLWWATPTYDTEETDDKIKLSTDFVNPELTAADVTQLVTALQQDAISYQTFFWYLQRGGIIPPDRTIEEESAMIDAGKPGAAGQNPLAALEAQFGAGIFEDDKKKKDDEDEDEEDAIVKEDEE